MDAILVFISTYIHYWPLVCFCALLLAGFNIPVSEDVMIVMSSLVAAHDGKLLLPNYIGLYAGIYASDLINYWFGRILGSKLLNWKLVSKKLTPRRIQKIVGQLEKHGFLTYVVTRFIPFGVRNTLFMTSGMVHFSFAKFMLFDAVAAVISSSTLYFLVFFIGEVAADNLRILGYILFVLFVIAVIVLFIRHEKKKKGMKKPAEEPVSNE